MLGCAALAAVGLAAAPAASATAPAAPSGVHLTSVTTTSFTVTANRAKNATKYRVWVSPVKGDLYATALSKSVSRRVTRVSSRPTLYVSRLAYRAAPYYYRYATYNGSTRRLDAVRTVSLRPATPTRVAASVSGAVSVSWSAPSATRYQIALAGNSGLRSAVVRTVRGANSRYTPYGLHAGTRYWFKVRAVNGSTASPWSSAVSAVPTKSATTYRIATYNLMYAGATGHPAGGETIASWAHRRTAAAKTLASGSPDVVGVQESVCTVVSGRRTFQTEELVSSLNTASSKHYALAPTEASNRPYCPTAQYTNHIVYNTAAFTDTGFRGAFKVGTCNGSALYAVYDLLRSRATRGPLLFVTSHNCAGASASADAARKTQAQALVNGVRSAVSRSGVAGLKVIVTGDFNSAVTSWHPTDTPGPVLRAAGYSDSWYTTQSMSNTKYSSYNGYRRVPLAQGQAIDRVFASPGVALRSWTQQLRLSRGRFADTYIPSDHNPVVVTADVPAA